MSLGPTASPWGAALHAALAHAAEAYPLEACGLLVQAGGQRTAERWRNTAASATRFALDDYPTFARLEALIAAGAEIAVYHSHPDGSAAWSATDAALWTTPLGPSWNVAHVVLAVSRSGPASAAGYRWSDEEQAFVTEWRLPLEPGR